MTQRWYLWLSLALLGCTQACLASKNDIRLLQNELQVSRAAEAHADSSRAVEADSIRRLLFENAHQTDNLFAGATRASRSTAESLSVTAESLAVLSNRFTNFSANAAESSEQLETDIRRVQAMIEAQANRIAALERRDEQQAQSGASGATGGAPGNAPGAQARDSGFPSPADLLARALNAANLHACNTSREMYGDFLQHYPTDKRAVDAQANIGDVFRNCDGDPAAADSIYQVVIKRYPGTDQAASALWHHAMLLCNAHQTDSAKVALGQIVRDYPISTAEPGAKARLRQADACAQ